MNDDRNIFEKIIDGEAPAEVVYEDDRCIAILDLFPAAPGHTLVISKRSEPDIFSIPAGELAHCHRVSQEIAEAVIDAGDCEGINILQNNGEAAGQEVHHFHLHVIPRYPGDDVKLPSPGDKADENYMDRWGENIRQNLG